MCSCPCLWIVVEVYWSSFYRGNCIRWSLGRFKVMKGTIAWKQHGTLSGMLSSTSGTSASGTAVVHAGYCYFLGVSYFYEFSFFHSLTSWSFVNLSSHLLYALCHWPDQVAREIENRANGGSQSNLPWILTSLKAVNFTICLQTMESKTQKETAPLLDA